MEFRKMRRFKQELPLEECEKVLSEQWRGVLAVLGDGGYPYAVPMNFVYDAAEKKLYFHGAGEGHKIDAIRACDRVSFNVIDGGVKRPDHWSKDFRSVTVFGKIRILSDSAQTMRALRMLGNKYYTDKDELEAEIRSAASRATCLELSAEHITGKRVNES